jgi:hypothetical protein
MPNKMLLSESLAALSLRKARRLVWHWGLLYLEKRTQKIKVTPTSKGMPNKALQRTPNRCDFTLAAKNMIPTYLTSNPFPESKWTPDLKPVVVLDEPNEGIQPNIVKQIGDVITLLDEQEGMTVLLVEQKLIFARRVGKEFRLMEKDRVFASGAIPELSDELIAKYLAV